MTLYGGGTTATCPDCGRPVPPGDTKLCRYCGYPLMFESTARADATPAGVLRKPDNVDRTRDPERGFVGAAPQVVAPVQQLGPHCPACGHRSAARRVRCEVCAAELWPGAASPVRRSPGPGPGDPNVSRGVSLTTVAFVVAALAAVVAVYFLAYALA
jgi:predicted amidophosphoribosyltransferase